MPARAAEYLRGYLRAAAGEGGGTRWVDEILLGEDLRPPDHYSKATADPTATVIPRTPMAVAASGGLRAPAKL